MNQKFALLSVYDKTNIVDFAKKLTTLGYSIISTGGTAKALTDGGIQVTPVEKITGNPESFDKRMKTVSFQIEGGILFDRNNPKHVERAKQLGVVPIDIVVCNLYPFEQTTAKPETTVEQAIEQIDVGGPTMVRSAAKNFAHVLVVTDTKDYETVTLALTDNNVTRELRQELAAKAFAHLSLYDSQIARYLSADVFPNEITIPGRLSYELRYGENPHQQAAVYITPNSNSPFQHLEKKAGRDLSLTNVTDMNAGIESLRLLSDSAAVVIKHNTPCGIATGQSAKEALERAIEADPESAFGGIIVMNRPMDKETAAVIGNFKNEKKSNIDIVAVPGIEPDALQFLSELRKTMGIYTFGDIAKLHADEKNIKFLLGGFALQNIDYHFNFTEWKVVTKKAPTDKQLEQMRLAWLFISRIKSNAIIVVDKAIPMTRGIGTGQTSRIRSAKIALTQAGEHAKDAVLASDSFFPFDDTVKLAARSGIAAIVQQGGSVNDAASIDAADKAGIAMVFTNQRAFWH